MLLWGGGSCMLASKQIGRRFIGFEVDQNYVDICNKRLSQEVLF